MNLWNKYGKTLVAAAFAIYTAVVPQLSGDKGLDANEGIILALAIVNALMVYVVPMTKSFPGIKTVVNALGAALLVAQTVIADGLDPNDWMLIIGAAVAALGVLVAPAYSPKEHVLVTAGSDKAVIA